MHMKQVVSLYLPAQHLLGRSPRLGLNTLPKAFKSSFPPVHHGRSVGFTFFRNGLYGQRIHHSIEIRFLDELLSSSFHTQKFARPLGVRFRDGHDHKESEFSRNRYPAG